MQCKPSRIGIRNIVTLTMFSVLASGCVSQQSASMKYRGVQGPVEVVEIEAAPEEKVTTRRLITERRIEPAAKVVKVVVQKKHSPAAYHSKWVVKSGRIQNTFSQAAQSAGIPSKHIHQLESLFAEQIDFRRDIRKGDRFTVILKPGHGGSLRDGTVMAAELSSRGKVARMIRHTDRQGVTRYHNGRGEPLGADFLRYPVSKPKISSHFTMRRFHPVLKVHRPHRGTDFKAAKGTPVFATADGVVKGREKQHGYGNVVFLQHLGGKYTTVYAHLSRFAKWVKPGKRVNQGDIIGYVGSTGLSTGPHLHYELRRGDKYLDAMKVALPRKQALSAAERKYFYQSTAALRRALLTEKSGGQIALINK